MELFKALPDQVTSEQLTVAFRWLESVCEITPPDVRDGTALATALQGTSRAVSDIVLSQGRVENTALYKSNNYNPSIMPPMAYHNIIRHYSGEHNEFMFTAQPDIGLGAYMSMSFCTPISSDFLCG